MSTESNKKLLKIDTISSIKDRMKYCTFMKNKNKKGSPEYSFWEGKRQGLRTALICLQLTIKDFK